MGAHYKTVITDQNIEQTATLYRIKLRSDVEIWQLFENNRDNECTLAKRNGVMIQYLVKIIIGTWYEKESDLQDTVKAYENGEIVDIPTNGINLYDLWKNNKPLIRLISQLLIPL